MAPHRLRGYEALQSPRSAPTQFGRYLAEHGIRHVVRRVNHPQANGTMERPWYEYDRHRGRLAILEEFVREYDDGIHESLGTEIYETPTEAWQRKVSEAFPLGQFKREEPPRGGRNSLSPERNGVIPPG